MPHFGGQICSFLAINKQIEGLLVLEDVPRPEISRLSADLHTAGVKETILLTGDNEVVAQKVGGLSGTWVGREKNYIGNLW